MKSKQGMQIIILAVVLIGLVIAVVVQFGGSKKTTAPKTTKQSTSQPAKAAAQTTTTDDAKKDMSWINPNVISLIGNAASLRDPFENLAGFGVAPPTFRTITPPQRSVFQQRPIEFPVFNQRGPEVIKPVPPPIPDFVLAGVFSTWDGQRSAVIKVQKYTYTLQEGESFPDLGWTVTRITPPNYVKLTNNADKTQSITIPLSGGGPK